MLHNSFRNAISTYSPATKANIERYHQLSSHFSDLNDSEQKELKEKIEFMVKIREIPEPGSLEDRIDRFLKDKLPL